MYLIKYIFKKNSKIKIFIKPLKNSLQTILRAPYRHKLTKHQLTFSRYNVLVSISILIKNSNNFNQISNVVYSVNNIKKYYTNIETNICNLNKIKIFFTFKLKNFFEMVNYKSI
jgi:hypothetical protein